MTDKKLTQKQLLAMPKSAYMNEDQLRFFKDLLVKMKAEILENVESFRAELGELVQEADENDQASLEEQRSLKLRLIERQSNVIPKIMKAIGLIESGDYGYCEETGEEIGLERLLARPTATQAIESKTINELKERVQLDTREEE